MSAGPHDEGPQDRGGSTLGALLYADQAKACVPERDWVALVRAIAGGDQQALQAVYERMHRIVFTLIMRIVHDKETAEELTLDVFHDVWRKASGYDSAQGTVVGWIMNQARSRAIDRVRFEQRKKRVDPGIPNPLTALRAQDSSMAFDLREQTRRLHGAVAVLSAEERVAIEAAFFGELTHAEVAKRLQQPLGTIKTRIRSGLAKLREALAKEEKGQ